MSELELTGRTLGGYQVDGLLGRGAFGWVYRARQVSLDRAVALKVLDPVVARNPDAARRFDREGRSAAALDHPAIVDVYDADTAGGLHYLAMRLIDGIALDELLRRRRLAPAEAMVMLTRIAAALDHAHAAGVVHRDVKPANILLQYGDPARAWLGDFGIAVSVRVPGDVTTTTVGTAHYAAPEQLTPAGIGPRSDQYSLACVAYEALTGRRPYDSDSDDVMAVLLAHRSDPVPPAGSAALDAVFARALAKAPADRYATVTEFTTALDAAIRTPATAAHRRFVVAGIAVVVAAAAATAAVFLWPGGDPPAAGGEAPAEAPEDWPAVRGPGDTAFHVPPDWRAEDGGAVTIFTDDGTQVLIAGGAKADADPAAELRKLYHCTGAVDTAQVAGLPAASCAEENRQVAVVAGHGTVVRFSFADSVSGEVRDEVLASLTINAS
jgi:protein kinase-like protein